MAYSDVNYRSKKALKEAVASGEPVHCHQPGGMFPLRPGASTIEGPHYPMPHRWYAAVVLDESLNIVPGSVK